MVYSGLQIVH